MTRILALAALVASLAVAFLMSSPVTASAHRTELCGSQSRPAVYVPCRRSYARKAVKGYMRLLSGNPIASDRWVNLWTIGDYGRHWWFTDFDFKYNEPGPFRRVRRCRGRMILRAHSGEAVRVERKHGTC